MSLKILVTGNAGSGKSTFGKELSRELGIPLYGLDKIVWKENWTPTPKDERQQMIKKIMERDSWVIEGVSKLVLNGADKVYFLNISVFQCVINIVKRFFKNGLGSRKDLPDNCPEYIGFLKAIKIAFIFNRMTRPWLLERKNKNGFIHVKSYQELEGYK